VHKSIATAITSLGIAGSLAVPTGALAASGSYTGAGSKMKWGTVTVRIAVSGRRITNISSTYPAERPRSAYINKAAVTILRQQALRSQSYKLHNLSGATMTTLAFENSLASAMHMAHLV
jgi:uncharacterized protein with FMN-binding domain